MARLTSVALDTGRRGTPDRRLVYTADGGAPRVETDPDGDGHFRPAASPVISRAARPAVTHAMRQSLSVSEPQVAADRPQSAGSPPAIIWIAAGPLDGRTAEPVLAGLGLAMRWASGVTEVLDRAARTSLRDLPAGLHAQRAKRCGLRAVFARSTRERC